MNYCRIQNTALFIILGVLLSTSVIVGQTRSTDSTAASDTIGRNIVDSAALGSTLTAAAEDSQAAALDQQQVQPISEVKTAEPAKPEERWRLTAGKVVWALFALVLAFIIIRFLTNILERISERWGRFRLLIKRLIPTFRILIWTLVLYEVITVILAPPLETIIAVSAAVGLSIGLASQDILKNIFGGIIILLDRPFQVGDKIEAGGHYGEVKQIGLRTVRIVTPDDNLVSIPNADIMNQAVSNANAGEPNCQVVAEIFLPADTDTEKAREIAYMAAATSRYIYLNKPIAIIIKNEVHEGRSLFKLRLKAYVLDIRYEFPFMSEMTETVMKELLDAELVTPDELQWIRINNTEATPSS